MNRILKGWNFRRLLYLAGGIMIGTQAIMTHQYALVLFGLYFAGMAVFNVGCAAGYCSVDPNRLPRKKAE